MGFWAAIPMIASMGAQAMGTLSGAEATIEGAEASANIEKLKRDYATKVFDEDIDRLKPFYDAGVQAGVKYGDAITNRLDPTKSGAYQAKLGLISEDLAGQPEYVREGAIEKLGAIEGEKQKGRLMDLQQIGLGAAGSAGTSRLNLGNILAQSYGLTGMTEAGAKQYGGEERQSAWNVAASQISGLPSYFASERGVSPSITHIGTPSMTLETGGKWGR